MQVRLTQLNKFFDRFFLICFLILCMGIPLTFSSITRSVFEVNKLLLLRIIILLVYGAWIFKSVLLHDNNQRYPDSQCYTLFGFRFRRIGLEIPFILWITVTLISIAASHNIFIGLIGAYDRWEGLATTLNYIMLFYMVAKLINNNKYRLLIFCLLLFSTYISSMYGVIQSLGLDFMTWSASPVHRVFACINNPVHFCAYVAMIVPLGLSLTHHFLHRYHLVDIPTAFSPVLFKSGICLAIVCISFFTSFNYFSMAFFQYLGFFICGAACLHYYTHIIPNKTFILSFLAFLVFYCGCLALDMYLLTPLHTTTLFVGLAFAWCFFALPHRPLVMYRICCLTTLIVFYSMFLSYSRATIVGFCVSFAFYYILTLSLPSERPSFIKLAILFFGILFTNLTFIFQLYSKGFLFGGLSLALLTFSFGLFYYSCVNSDLKKFSLTSIGTHFILSILIFLPILNVGFIPQYKLIFCFLLFSYLVLMERHLNHTFLKTILICALSLLLTFYSSSLTGGLLFLFYLGYLLYFVLRHYFKPDEQYHFAFMLASMLGFVLIPLFILMFGQLLTGYSNILSFQHLTNYIFFLLCLLSLLWIYLPQAKKLLWSSALFLLVMVPLSSSLVSTYSNNVKNSETMLVANNIVHRMSRISDASGGRPRFYMWASVPAWIKDFPLFGSGPDTIRYLYPRYRHPKYGMAEGGHNFTPDRLHNEYFNTLVSTGFVGFFVKFILVYGFWYYYLLQLLSKHFSRHKRYILIGIICSPTIYLIQVLFNFGVVATLFLFYFLMGLGLSFINDEYETAH